MKIIDAHAHIFIPEAYAEAPQQYFNDIPRIIKNEKNRGIIKIGEKLVNVPSSLYSVDDRLLQMKDENIDMQILSIYPRFLFYKLKIEEAYLFARMFNDALSNLIKDYNKYFLGLGTVPLQNVDVAIKEMERIKRDLGLIGVEIGSNVNGSFLGESKFLPFFEAAERLGVLLFVHPSNPVCSEKMDHFGLDVYVGNICDTSITIASMIFSGVFDKFPRLKIYFAHGGGFIPYQIGRLVNAYLIDDHIKTQIQTPPSLYLSKFSVDTVVYDLNTLDFLVRQVPIENILLGSDSPVDLRDKNIVSKIEKLKISQKEKELILGGNIQRLLHS
jgi:aminocarboxymuconate-semialdehyde decarboxylase